MSLAESESESEDGRSADPTTFGANNPQLTGPDCWEDKDAQSGGTKSYQTKKRKEIHLKMVVSKSTYIVCVSQAHQSSLGVKWTGFSPCARILREERLSIILSVAQTLRANPTSRVPYWTENIAGARHWLCETFWLWFCHQTRTSIQLSALWIRAS